YANWEGFYNECVEIYLNFLSDCTVSITSTRWLLLTGALTAEFESLRSRNHSLESRREFVEKLQARLGCGFDQFDRSIIMSRSNLDFSKLRDNFHLLGL